MIMAKDSNGNYVKVEDIKQQDCFNGISPIEFKGSGENLENYRIYGNTISSESVGDRTANLFDGELLCGYWDSITTIANTSSPVYRSFKLLLPAGTYTFSVTTEIKIVRIIVDGVLIQNVGDNITSYTVTSTTDNYIGFSFRITGATQTPWDDSPIMLNPGSTALPYEPYGYRVLVTIEGKNLLDYSSLEVGRFDFSTGEKTPDSSQFRTSAPIKVKPNESYAISGVASGQIRVFLYDDNMNMISTALYSDNDIVSTTSSTMFANIAGIKSSWSAQIQFELGSEATEYEPYHTPITTNIYLPEQIKMVGNEAEYVDFGEQKQHRVRKNLLQNTAASRTINGVTFTVNEDGSVTCNGTATKITSIILSNNLNIDESTILSGCPINGGVNSYLLRFISLSPIIINEDVGSGTIINNFRIGSIEIRIASGYTCDNLTFYPMIRKADILDDTYEPYITDTDIDVTLPALPALSGTNILSVNTNIKPSKVWGRLNDPGDILYVKDKLGNILFSKYYEIEDEPPLTYKAIEGALKNYRIYGNTVNGESVGDRTDNVIRDYIVIQAQAQYTNVLLVDAELTPNTTYSFTCLLNDSRLRLYVNENLFNTISYVKDDVVLKVVVKTLSELPDSQKINGKWIMLKNSITEPVVPKLSNIMMIEGSEIPEIYEPYGYRIPVKIEGKNLLQNTATSRTVNGVTFTVNEDGSITVYRESAGAYGAYIVIKNGYNDDSADHYDVPVFYSGEKIIPSTNNPDIKLRIRNTDGTYRGQINNNEVYTPSKDVGVVYIEVEASFFGSAIIYPMIRRADISDDTYEPYQTTVTTNIYLPEQIKMVGDEVEYINYKEQKQHRVRKNLFDAAKSLVSAYIGGINFDYTISSSGSYSILLKCMPNTTYTATFPLNNPNHNICWCSFDREPMQGNIGSNVLYIAAGSLTNLSYTTSADAAYMMLFLYNSASPPPQSASDYFQRVQIEKGSTATDYEPYIENTELDVTIPALPTLSGTNILSVDTIVQPSKINLKGKIKGTIYGWHVDPDVSDSSNAVTYLEDAVGMTPVAMGSTTFTYGSWENAFFMPKPCMLKSNGKVDYYLDPNDYTKKLDGTASDIANPNYDGNAMMEWPKIWFKYVKGVKEGQGYFYVANYKADGNFHCWCNYDSEDNEIDHFYTAIYNGTSFANYDSSKTYVINDFAIYDNKLYKCNTDIATAQAFDNTKWDLISNTAPAINKMRSLSGIRLTDNNGNAQTNTTTEITRATANNTTSVVEWYIETFSDRLLINGLLVLMGKSLNTQAVFGRGLDTGGQSAKEAYVTGTLNDKGLFWGVTGDGNSGVKAFGMENYWSCCWHRVAGLITNNHAVKLKLTYGTKDGSTVVGYNQTGNGYIDNGTAPYSNEYVQKMLYNKYGFVPAVVTDGSSSTYYTDYHYQNASYTGIIYALFGGRSGVGLGAGVFCLSLSSPPGTADWYVAASLSCKPLL